MKKWFKSKSVKLFFKLLAIPALFGIVVASTTYTIFSNSNTNLLSNQNTVVSHADSISNSGDQPTIDDVVNGDVSSLNQPIATNNGNYILPTLTPSSIPGLIKVNSFVSPFYGINFNDFNGYHVRQVLQNYNDQNQYFVLLVNDNASATSAINTATDGTTTINFSIANPGHILEVQDTESGFNIVADYQLDAPILDQSMISYYAGMYFQAPMDPNLEQTFRTGNDATPWNLIIPADNSISGPTNRPNLFPTFSFTSTNTTYKKITDTWTGYTQNIATVLYLNSLNNMVFVSNKNQNSGSDAIYLFGGNQIINLWFYTFNVNQNNQQNATVIENAVAYANYRVFFPDISGPASSYDSSDIDTQKAYNFNLNPNDRNWGTADKPSSWSLNPYLKASFFGYYVSGAKYINKPNPQIELALTIPNFALFNLNQPVIFSTNVMINSGNKYLQSPQSRILNLYGSISPNSAIQTTQFRNEEVSAYINNGSSWSSSDSWLPRYSNQNYNFIEVTNRDNGTLQFSVNATANDGYKSQMYNKLVAYLPESIGNDNIALKYSRGQMTAVIVSQRNQPSYSTQLLLYKSNTKMNDLVNISFSENTWFLTYKAKDDAKSTIYTFNYNSTSNQSIFSKTNLVLDGNLDVLNILPLSSDFIYVLAKDTDTNKVTTLLYRLTPGIIGNYQEDKAYNNLVTNNQVVKVNGVPAYASNGIQNNDQKAIWGTVSFKNIDYLQNAGFLANPASVLASDPTAVNTLVNYTPGWEGQDVKITSKANDNNQLEVQVNIKYLNGLYYSPQQLSAQNSLNQVYGGFSALPSWVLPVAIAVPILFLAIVVALGLGIGIPMAKSRKLQDKGFSNTFKKVDTLTSAVGSVYKKIMTETQSKKQPQLLNSKQKVSPPLNSSRPFINNNSNKVAPPPIAKPPLSSSIKKPVPPKKPIVSQKPY